MPPAGYQPIFINHINRHGARHLTKAVDSTGAYKTLMKAGNLHGLTKKGEELKKMVILLQQLEQSSIGFISYEGAQELQGIARRMFENNKPAFARWNNERSVMVTKEIRTHQSADTFLFALKQELHSNQSISLQQRDALLRFYDLPGPYIYYKDSGYWRQPFKQFEQLLKYNNAAKNLVNRLFLPAFLKQNPIDAGKFATDIFGFACIIPSLDEEIAHAHHKRSDFDFLSFFTCHELNIFGRAGNAEEFLLKGPGMDSLGIQVMIAGSLLKNFIATTDSFLEQGKVPVHMRFAHAETVAPLAAIMSINNASVPAAKLSSFDKVWKAEQVIPLSANIQWILYANENKQDILVKILLNEKEVHIGDLKTDKFPFYHWNDLRSFYIKKLIGLGLW